MKTSVYFASSLLLSASFLAGCITKDPYDIRPTGEDAGVPTAVAWQNANDRALSQSMSPESLGAHVQSSEAADALLAQVKGAYVTDPMVATRIAAVTQLVMCPTCKKAKPARAVWSSALLAAAAASEDAYRTVFLLDQLRWCGTPDQAERVQAIGDKAKEPCVKEFAAWVARELRASAARCHD